jgi:hypothetical protein
VNFSRVLYGPAYATFGVIDKLDIAGNKRDIRARDLTSGFVVPGSVDIETEMPMASVRSVDFEALGIPISLLDGSSLLLNDVLWNIASHRNMPSPNGDRDGEIYLILEAATF